MSQPGSRLKEIFGAAIGRAGPDRAEYLARACEGDPTLRGRVEALLGSFDEASRFLGSASPGGEPAEADGRWADEPGGPPVVFVGPPGSGSTADAGRPVDVEGPGTVIGPYKLLQKIGQGGMGTVFMAEQEKPVRRKVALKLIRPGMDSAQVVARFEAERQALAMMDHANIARVLDVGSTPTGRPFFVMELVRGVPITEYCDRNHLTPRERLELFLPACRAIQHAHQKGIIHRDIKPSNVLVTLRDGAPEPKVIDFGVAKAVEQRLTERTMFTEFGAIIGTLEYMSPEQAEMGALDVDTRSDIYSLGVLLYELLTGSTPLERGRIRDAGYSEVLRRIREEDPPRPSTRLSGSKALLPTISAQRKMEPERLSRLIRGELDWIVMKALEKDRTRRYETAIGLARDLRRFLDGETVEACPPSATYRIGKFARRNRTALLTAGAFVGLLVAATALSTTLAIRALRAEKQATDLKRRAQAGEQTAIDAVQRFGEVVRDTFELKHNQVLAQLRRNLLAEPQSFFMKLRERLKQSRDTSTDSIAKLADASFQLGALTSEVGSKEAALERFEESRDLRRDLVRLHPEDRRYQAELARSEAHVGMIEADRWHFREALGAFERALVLRKALAAEGPDSASSRAEVAQTLHAIGNLRVTMKRPNQALAAFEDALPIWRRLANEVPERIRYLGDLTYCLTQIGTLRPDPARWAEALELYQDARPLREQLARTHPGDVWYSLDLASNQFLLGMLQETMGSLGDAVVTLEGDAQLWQDLIDLDPSNTRYIRDQGRTLTAVGELHARLDHPDAAAAALKRALQRWESLNRDYPDDAEFADGLAATLQGLARLDERGQRGGEALARLRRALDLLRRNVAASSHHLDSWNRLRDALDQLIRIARRAGRADEAANAEREREALLGKPPAP